MEERRQKGRIQTSLRILDANPDLSPLSCITNLSGTGAFISTDEPHPVDTSIAFDIKLPGDPERMTINARVVWTKSVSNATSAGMGIEFTDILDRHHNKLAEFIEQSIRAEGAPGQSGAEV